jgi:hypothetical protein
MSANKRPAMLRRKILIYPKFQLSLVAVNIVTMIAVFGAIQFQIFSAVGDMQDLGSSSDLSSGHFYNRFIEYQMSILYSGLALYLGIAFILSCGFTLFISHRLAGPLVRMQKYFKQIEENGKVEQPLKFRDGDFLQELPETINNGLKRIQGLNVQTDSDKKPD